MGNQTNALWTTVCDRLDGVPANAPQIPMRTRPLSPRACLSHDVIRAQI